MGQSKNIKYVLSHGLKYATMDSLWWKVNGLGNKITEETLKYAEVPYSLAKGTMPYNVTWIHLAKTFSRHAIRSFTSSDPAYYFTSRNFIKISNNIDAMLKSNNTQGVG